MSKFSGSLLSQVKRLGAMMSWGMFGSFSYAFGRFAVFVLLTKYLTAQEVGQFVLALAVVTPLSFLVNLELRMVYVTDTAAAIDAGQCLGFRLATNGLFVICLVLVGWALSGCWGWDKILILWLVGLLRVVESIGDIYLGVLQKNEWIKQIGLSQMIKTAGIFLLAWFILTTLPDLRYLLVGWSVVVALMVWFYDRRWAMKVKPIRCTFSREVAYKLLRRAWPLGLLITVTSFHESLPRLILEHFRSEEAVAYYAALAMIVTGLAILQNGVNQAFLARLARYAAESITKFWKLLGSMLLICWSFMFLLLLLAFWQGEWILQQLYQASYARQSDILVIVILAGFFLLSSMILGDALLACHRFKTRLFSVITGLAVNAVGCWLTIPEHGLAGAAWSSLMASATVTLICALVLLQTNRATKPA